MTDKQTDTKTYNCVYCNKTLTKFETQPLYKDGEFLTTCEECWNKHAKEEGYVVSDVQTINITIDDLINGNLRDMEFTAQFGVYRQAVKGLAEQLKAKEQECEELRKEIAFGNNGTLSDKIRAEVFKELHEENRKLKEDNEILEKVNKTNQEKIKKLNEQVEEEFIAQQYGDMALFWKVEDYKQALTEIKEIADTLRYYTNYGSEDDVNADLDKILQKCEVLDE